MGILLSICGVCIEVVRTNFLTSVFVTYYGLVVGTLGGLRRLEEQGVGRRGERLAAAGPAAQEVVLAPPETAAAAGSAAAVVFGDAADPQRGPRDRNHRGGSDVDVLEVQLRLQQDRRRQM